MAGIHQYGLWTLSCQDLNSRQAAYLGHNLGWRCCQPVAQPKCGGRLIEVTILIASYKGTASLKPEDCVP